MVRYFNDASYATQTPWHAGLAEILDDGEAVVPYLRADLEASRDNPFRQMDLAAYLAYNGEPELAFVALRTAVSSVGLMHTHVWMPLFAGDLRGLGVSFPLPGDSLRSAARRPRAAETCRARPESPTPR